MSKKGSLTNKCFIIMKNLFCLLAAAGLLFLYGCNENNEPEIKTGFSLGRNIVEMPPEGGSATVVWVVENPEDGVGIVIGEDHPDWVNSFDISEFGKIHFNVDSTDIEVDSRECEVSVTYGETTQTFRVIQAGADPAIDFQVLTGTPTSIILSSKTRDESMNTYVNIIEKSVWDTYDSDEALLNEDMATFRYLAELSGQSLEQYLNMRFEMIRAASPYYRMRYVTNSDNGFREVAPDTEYVVYVYGMNGQGEVLSRVYSEECATEAFDLSNPTTFEIDVNVEGTYVTADVKPSDKNQRYYAGFRLLNGEMPSGEELAKQLHDAVEGSIFSSWSHPENTVPFSEIIEKSFPIGDITIEGETGQAAAKGFVFAYTVDDRGVITGMPSVKEFSTEDVTMSDNVITLNVTDIGSYYATLTTTTTNDDPYNVMIAPYSPEYDELSGQDLISALGMNPLARLVLSGQQGGTVMKIENLFNDREYMAVGYGYDKKLTTSPVIFRFTTLP